MLSFRDSTVSIARLALLILAIGTADACTRTGNRSLVPPELVIVERAQNVRVNPEPGGGVSLAYDVREPFPAAPVVAKVRNALPAAVWMPLTEDWLNPGSVGATAIAG